VPAEPADRQPVQKKMVDVAAAFNAGMADLDPIAFDATFSSEGLCGIFPSEGIGGVRCWFFGHADGISTLTGAWKDSDAGTTSSCVSFHSQS